MTYVAFIAPPAASGGTVTTGFTNGNPSGDFNQTGSLNQFNPALGTLVDATLRLTMRSQSTSVLATLSGDPGPWDILAVFSRNLRVASNISAINTYLSSLNPVANVTLTTPIFSIDSGNSPHAFADMSGTVVVDISLNSLLSSLIGTGTVLLNGRGLSSLALGGGGGFVGLSGSGNGGFDALLTYTYT